MTDLIYAGEAAHLLGVKPDTINKYVRRGLLTPAEKLTPRLWRYRRADVEALAANPPKRTGAPKKEDRTMITFRVEGDALSPNTFSFRTADVQTAVDRLCTRVYGEPSTGRVIAQDGDLLTIHPYPKSDTGNKSLRIVARRLA